MVTPFRNEEDNHASAQQYPHARRQLELERLATLIQEEKANGGYSYQEGQRLLPSSLENDQSSGRGVKVILAQSSDPNRPYASGNIKEYLRKDSEGNIVVKEFSPNMRLMLETARHPQFWSKYQEGGREHSVEFILKARRDITETFGLPFPPFELCKKAHDPAFAANVNERHADYNLTEEAQRARQQIVEVTNGTYQLVEVKEGATQLDETLCRDDDDRKRLRILLSSGGKGIQGQKVGHRIAQADSTKLQHSP